MRSKGWPLHYRGLPFALEEFRSALTGAGAEFLTPTNEWEALRYRLDGKVGIVYFNKKMHASPTGAAGQHYANFAAGRDLTMSGRTLKRAKRDAKRDAAPTLYTDASLNSATKVGTWAAILVMPDGAEHVASGVLKGEITSSAAAEARAIANAIHRFLHLGHIAGSVRVVCDNQTVVKHLASTKLKSKSLQVREAFAHIDKLRNRLSIFPEWVKGHQPLQWAAADPRILYNRRCDKMARHVRMCTL